jgi:putative ABC transport system substrate-binding protein
MERRAFVAGIVAALGLSRAAFAETSGAVPEIVLFYSGPIASAEARAKVTRETLGADGLVEVKNFVLSISVATDNTQLTKLANELVRPGVAAILAVGPAPLRAARAATATIPIVAIDLETDPVKGGFAQNHAHPGGNVTGLFFDFPEFSGKLLGLLQEAKPGLSQVAAVWDPASGTAQIEAAEATASARGIKLQVLKVDDLTKLPVAFAAAEAAQAQGLIVLSSPCSVRSVASSGSESRRRCIGWPGSQCFPNLRRPAG